MSDWKSKAKAKIAEIAPAGSPARGVAAMGLSVVRAARSAGKHLADDAEARLAFTDIEPPYPYWLSRHRRAHVLPHLPAARRDHPMDLSAEVVLVSAPDGPGAAGPSDFAGQIYAPSAVHRVGIGELSSVSDMVGESNRSTVLFFAVDGDEFEPDTFLRVCDAMWENPGLDLVSFDFDVRSASGTQPRLTPTFSLDAMLSANVLGRSFAVRQSAFVAVGGLDGSLGADAFWDLALKVIRRPDQARRIPFVLGHLGSGLPEIGPRSVDVVQRELDRRSWPATARAVPGAVWLDWQLAEWPTVSIVIPSRFNQPLLDALLPTLQATDYPSFDVTVTDNSGATHEKAAYYAGWTVGSGPVQVIWGDPTVEFNYSRTNNEAVAQTTGEIVLLLNDDTECPDPSWLRQLVGWASRPEIGTVGAQMLDGEGRIQHGGVVMGMNGLAEHLFGRMEPHRDTKFGHTDWIRNTMAVTAACVAIRRDVWDEIGGFDERFVLCGSDVVLGLDAHLLGLRNVVAPSTGVLHLESATRGEFNAFGDMFTSYWRYQRWIAGGDPFYSPSLSLQHGEPQLALAAAPSALDLVGPALGRQFTVFAQSTSQQENAHFAHTCFADDALVERIAARHAANAAPREVRTVTWFLPEFDNPFYGGINSALRIAEYLQRVHHVESRFALIAGANEHWFRSAIRAAFPTLADSKMAFMPNALQPELDRVAAELGHTDVAIASIWHSAYAVANYTGSDRSAYLVQDFEPGFYPNGTLFALAEETYKLGLYGVCNSPTMGTIYRDRYHGKGMWFMPAVDHSVFHPPTETDSRPDGDPLRVFLYARPGHWRNCWEIASRAILSVKAKYGDRVHFVSAGSWARPGDVGIAIEQLGLLDYKTTGDLYRTCDVGIALTVSEHPSYLPIELGACGVPVIAFDLPAGYWVLKDGENSLLSRRTAAGLAERIEQLIVDADLRAKLSAGALAHSEAVHGDWDRAFADIYPYLCDPEGYGQAPK